MGPRDSLQENLSTSLFMIELNPALSFPNVQMQLYKPVILTILFNKLKTNWFKNFKLFDPIKIWFHKDALPYSLETDPLHIIAAKIFGLHQHLWIHFSCAQCKHLLIYIRGKFNYPIDFSLCSESVLDMQQVSEVCNLKVVSLDTYRLRPELAETLWCLH